MNKKHLVACPMCGKKGVVEDNAPVSIWANMCDKCAGIEIKKDRRWAENKREEEVEACKLETEEPVI